MHKYLYIGTYLESVTLLLDIKLLLIALDTGGNIEIVCELHVYIAEQMSVVTLPLIVANEVPSESLVSCNDKRIDLTTHDYVCKGNSFSSVDYGVM